MRSEATAQEPEAWRTDDDLIAAYARFAARAPGYVPPAAYAVARLDAETLTFGHINRVGGGHLLPAVVLASVCGHVAETATYELTSDTFSTAIALLTPAEAAEHVDHPNLWSWRALLEGSSPSSSFIAFFVRDASDEPVDEWDAQFRAALASG